MIERRDFLKRATMGTVGLTTVGGLKSFTHTDDKNCERIGNDEISTRNDKWKIDFNEENTQLTIINQNVRFLPVQLHLLGL